MSKDKPKLAKASAGKPSTTKTQNKYVTIVDSIYMN